MKRCPDNELSGVVLITCCMFHGELQMSVRGFTTLKTCLCVKLVSATFSRLTSGIKAGEIHHYYSASSA